MTKLDYYDGCITHHSYVFYSRLSDKQMILDTWSSSTKHPDSIQYFNDFNKTEWLDDKDQTTPFLLWCASQMIFPFHSYMLASFAIEMYECFEDTTRRLNRLNNK